jgi:hypothetical protein
MVAFGMDSCVVGLILQQGQWSPKYQSRSGDALVGQPPVASR